MLEGHLAEPALEAPRRLGRIVEGLHPHPLGEDAAGVDVGDAKARLGREPLGFRQEVAELVDHPLTVPGEVGGALPRPGGGIGVGGDRARGLRPAEQMPLVGLADGDVGGREIGQDGGSRQRRCRRWRGRRPEVLADLDVEDEARQIAGREDQIRPEGDRLPGEGERLPGDVAAVGEPALLVVFPVVRQVAFRHDAEELAPGDRQAAVVEASRAPDRRADQQHRAEAGARGDDVGDRRLDGVEQRGLQVQIVERVGRDAELGKDGEVDLRGVGAPRLLDDGVAVEADVGGAHPRRAGRHPHEAVSVHGVEMVGAARSSHHSTLSITAGMIGFSPKAWFSRRPTASGRAPGLRVPGLRHWRRPGLDVRSAGGPSGTDFLLRGPL